MTTVVETSHVVGTEHTDGLRLAYLPKYCDAVVGDLPRRRRTIYEPLHRDAARACARLHRDDVVDWTVQRAPLSSRCTRSRPRRRAPRRSGPASRASASRPPARSTRGCSTATRSCSLAEQVANETSERLRCPGAPPARRAGRRGLSHVPGRERTGRPWPQGQARRAGLSGQHPRARRAHGLPAGRHQPADRRLVGDGLDHPADLHRLRPRGDAAAVRDHRRHLPGRHGARAPAGRRRRRPQGPPQAGRGGGLRDLRGLQARRCCSSARASRR